MQRPARRRPVPSVVRNDSTGAASRLFPALFAFGFAATLVPILVAAPEGAIREGDFNPVALPFLLFAAVVAVVGLLVPLVSPPADKTDVPPKTDKTVPFFRRAVRVADAALGVFLVWATASYLALVVGKSGDVRLATNAYWAFATPALAYFFARRFRSFFNFRLALSVFVLIFACAVAESAHSFYSLTVATPRLRAAYRADPEGVLAANEMTFSSDAERTRFENRLLESSEPTGTFGLANTLAGLLAPTLVFGGAAFVSAVSRRRRKTGKSVKTVDFNAVAAPPDADVQALSPPASSRRSVPGVPALVVWAAALGLGVFILLATKSRSGFLGATFGVGVWGVLTFLAALRRAERKTARRVAFGTAGAFVGAALLLVGAFATGLLDREVFAEAGKSLGYRLDYWRSTAAMIVDFPLFGVGPGEFQSVYARYISPTASEFIADPHSFAFELAALFGLPALAAFLVFLAAVASAAVATVLTGATDAADKIDATAKNGVDVPFVGGAFVGLGGAFVASLFQTAPLAGAFVGSAFVAFALIFPTVSNAALRSDFSNAAILGALAAAFLNLCAAGGIGYPALTFPIFLLAAFAVDRPAQLAETSRPAQLVETPRPAQTPRRRDAAPLFFALGAVAVAAVFDTTAFRPWAAVFFFSLEPTAPGVAVFETGDPGKIDAASHKIVSQCYYFAGNSFATRPTPENRARWERLRAQARSVSPNSASLRESWADFDAALFADVARRSRREFLDSAIDFYRQAVDRSPTDAVKRAKLVAALRDAATLVAQPPADSPIPAVDPDAALADARREAKIALELDANTPHLDRKLPDETRVELARFLETAP